MVHDGFDGGDGGWFDGVVLDTPAGLGRAGIAQAVGLLTAVDVMPETVDALVDELCVYGDVRLRVATAAALLTLGFEVAVSAAPPEVRLADAVDGVRSQVVERFGSDTTDRVFDAAVAAAAAHCNLSGELSADLLHRFLGETSPSNRRFEMLMTLLLLCSAWVGPSGHRRSRLLAAVGLAAADRRRGGGDDPTR